MDVSAVDGLAGLALEELRVLRRDALEQEADLSYLRRLLHGRMDILRAELQRREIIPQQAAGEAPAPCWTGSRPSWPTPRPRPAARPGTSPSARRAASATGWRPTP
ncbi:hypothetical protein ACFQ2M_24165 [Kitasatospora saccharophila]|uniref:RsiG family protein n=1 Tax=Kitasatospora saccharophila TaxID=407973 RepID=UPI0036259208